MQRYVYPLILILFLVVPAAVQAEKANGCAPEFRALFDQAVVETSGTGEGEILVLTDPFCWHCRLAHKLLGEYPEHYKTVKIFFFPRRSFLGSDMAAWIIEDAAGTDQLKPLLDFAYKSLKQPKTDDLPEARMIVLMQFTEAFPELLNATTLPELAARLQHDHEAHVQKGADMARAMGVPGTPVLVAGSTVIAGYGPGPWLEALEKKSLCK